MVWLNLLGIFFWIKDSVTDVKVYYWQYPCFTWSGAGDFTELQLGKPALLPPSSSMESSASPPFDGPVKKKARTQSKQSHRTANPVFDQDEAKVEELDQSGNIGSDLWGLLHILFDDRMFQFVFCCHVLSAILSMFFDHRDEAVKLGAGRCIVSRNIYSMLENQNEGNLNTPWIRDQLFSFFFFCFTLCI